jgi:two-component system nitrogen regulation sensor histidine kinase NtrY
MFVVSVFYINNSFEKWFSVKMAGVLKSSLDVTNAYYLSAKKKNYHFAHQVAQEISHGRGLDKKRLPLELNRLLKIYSLDSIEYYPGLFKPRVVVTSKEESIPQVPPVSLEFLEKGVAQRSESSTIHHFGEGNLVRVIVPLEARAGGGALVVSTFVPLSLISKMDDITSAYDDFRDLNPLEYPVKSIYLIILVLMTLVILLCETWFGFYLAKQLSNSLEELGRATLRVAKGDFQLVESKSSSAEINQLIENFNQMTSTLEKSEKEVLMANSNLQQTLETLDEHTRYIEVVLSNVSTGVISVDAKGMITMINSHAAHLLAVKPEDYIGRRVEDVLNRDQIEIFFNLLRNMKEHHATHLQKEIRIDVRGETIPLQMALTLLYDDQKNELGKVLVFDDLSMLMNAQRAAAWREVARRIAHEIKNPLTPIKLSAERLQKKFGSSISDPAFQESTSMIIKQVDELKNMVNEFYSFARLPQLKPILSNLNVSIEEALVLFRTGHKNIQFLLEADESLPNFRFDPDQIKRVITNLISNAISALENQIQGQVRVSTKYDNLLKIVRISVLDNGPGIPGYLRNRIFEPYVTTKKDGSGLGLAIVKRIVEDHNGFIRVFAAEPQGTEIIIEFPVLETAKFDSNETSSAVDSEERSLS